MRHLRKIRTTKQAHLSLLFTCCNISVTLSNMSKFNLNLSKDILDRAIEKPAMMAFMILVGTYLTTGQLIPGVF